MYRKKNSTFKNIISHPSSLTVIGILILIQISLPLINNIKKRININNEISTLQGEIENLEGKNTELKGLISYLNSDEFTEEQARLNLNYKKEGEQVLVLKDNQENNEAESGDPSSIYSIKGLENRPEPIKVSNANKWVKYFTR